MRKDFVLVIGVLLLFGGHAGWGAFLIIIFLL